MKALLVGSEGNIGAPLARHLRHMGHEVRSADIKPAWKPDYLLGDINHPTDLLPAFEWRPDVVYLLAAVVSRVTCEQAAALAVETNVAGVNNVLQLCKAYGAKVVFFSTSEVYGPTDGPMREDATPHPNNRYGLTKWLAEQLVAYEVSRGLEAVIVRPFMIYGEDEDHGDHRSAMIRFAEHLRAGEPIEVHRGSARSWLHVSDAVIALEMVAEASGVLNIGHPDVIETVDLAYTIVDLLNADTSLIRVIDQPAGMTLRKEPDLTRQTAIGFAPMVDVVEGIRRVLA